jgi:hypothetical protein
VKKSKSICLSSFTLIGAFLLYGQARDTGSVFGTISDSQGAVVPGAAVTLTNIATGAARRTAVDSSGGFVFTLLPVGSYNLTVEQRRVGPGSCTPSPSQIRA